MTEDVGINNGTTLYIFMDESGNFDFSDKGSNLFILTAVTTISPLMLRESALSARYTLLEGGHDLEYFHATENAQHARNVFYEKIKTIDYEVDSVIAEKRKANRVLYEDIDIEESTRGGWKYKKTFVEERFYKQICETLLQYIIYRYKYIKIKPKITKVIVVLDQVLVNKKRDFVTKSIKTYMKNNFGIMPYMYFHSTKADINSQIADYCCWAIKKKWDDKDTRSYEEIKSKIKSEFDIFQTGTKKFY